MGLTVTGSRGSEIQTKTRPSTWLILLTAAVVVGLGILKLNLPLHNDQGTFANYARMMADGATLYEDVWDPKQPGVFYFFLAGGLLFGFREAGFHLLEMLYLVAGGVLGALWLRPRLTNRHSFLWYPILSVGWFYLLARFHDLGQVEALAGPLILGHIILSTPSDASGSDQRSPARRLLLAGVLVGLLGWLKLFLMAVPAVVAVVAAIATTRNEPLRLRSIVRYLGWQLGGVAIPLVGMVAWFAANGVLDTLWFTYVTHPLSLLGDRSETVLNKLVSRSFVIFLPMIALGVVALVRRARYPKSQNLFLMAVVAVVTSAAVVLTQTRWAYQANVAIFPAAILAVFGIDQIAEARSRGRIALTVVLLATLIPAVVVETPRIREGIEHSFGFGGKAREFQSAMDPQYEEILEALEHVDIPEDEVVYGTDTRVVWLSDRRQAIPISPWLAIHDTSEVAAQALDQLRATPADWFYIESALVVTESTEQLRDLLEEDYQFVAETLYGEWWVPAG